MTEQVGFHREEDHPPLYPMHSNFPYQSSTELVHFLCKLQVSLIMPNTNFNECLHQPSNTLCFRAKICGTAALPEWDFCNCNDVIFYLSFELCFFDLTGTIVRSGVSRWHCPTMFILCICLKQKLLKSEKPRLQSLLICEGTFSG